MQGGEVEGSQLRNRKKVDKKLRFTYCHQNQWMKAAKFAEQTLKNQFFKTFDRLQLGFCKPKCYSICLKFPQLNRHFQSVNLRQNRRHSDQKSKRCGLKSKATRQMNEFAQKKSWPKQKRIESNQRFAFRSKIIQRSQNCLINLVFVSN